MPQGRVEVCITASPLPFGTVLATFTAHGYSVCYPFVKSDSLTARPMKLGISFTHSQSNFSQNWESFSRNFEWSFLLISFKSSAVFSSWQCRCNSCRFLYSSLPPMVLGVMWSASKTSQSRKFNPHQGHLPNCSFILLQLVVRGRTLWVYQGGVFLLYLALVSRLYE